MESRVTVDVLFGGVLRKRRSEKLNKGCLLGLMNLMSFWGRVRRKQIGGQANIRCGTNSGINQGPCVVYRLHDSDRAGFNICT